MGISFFKVFIYVVIFILRYLNKKRGRQESKNINKSSSPDVVILNNNDSVNKPITSNDIVNTDNNVLSKLPVDKKVIRKKDSLKKALVYHAILSRRY